MKLADLKDIVAEIRDEDVPVCSDIKAPMPVNGMTDELHAAIRDQNGFRAHLKELKEGIA